MNIHWETINHQHASKILEKNMQVNFPHTSTAELLTLRPLSPPALLMQLLNRSQNLLFDSKWKKEKHKEPEKLQQLRTLYSQQTSLGEKRPTVSINTGWGFLELWQSFGTNRQTAASSIKLRKMTTVRNYIFFYGFVDGVLLPSWGKRRPQSRHLLAWRRPFLPTEPPCRQTPESALARDQQVAPQFYQRRKWMGEFLPFHPDGFGPAKLLLPCLI